MSEERTESLIAIKNEPVRWRGETGLFSDPGSELRLGREIERKKRIHGVSKKNKTKPVPKGKQCPHHWASWGLARHSLVARTPRLHSSIFLKSFAGEQQIAFYAS